LIHATNIVYETLDGETIVIHLDTGSYYSLTGAGAEIWDLLGQGHSSTQICAALAGRYARPESEISPTVEGFIAELEREALVEPSDPSPNAPSQAADGNRQWEPPKLECYDDMRDFLLVDPIHEVDESGWPKPGGSAVNGTAGMQAER
jgi:Coenzyme PQQ synthesis protein D (PqqD)